MPLDHGYGVAVGSYVDFHRAPPDQYGHWYHGHLVISTPSGNYAAALDVDTPGGGISYRLVDDPSSTDLGTVATLAAGFHPLAGTPTSGALDYVRSSILRDGFVVRWVRIRLRLYRASWLDRNQGDPPGPHQAENDIWQDGAVAVRPVAQHGERRAAAAVNRRAGRGGCHGGTAAGST